MKIAIIRITLRNPGIKMFRVALVTAPLINPKVPEPCLFEGLRAMPPSGSLEEK